LPDMVLLIAVPSIVRSVWENDRTEFKTKNNIIDILLIPGSLYFQNVPVKLHSILKG
jgi:hypothetical protein